MSDLIFHISDFSFQVSDFRFQISDLRFQISDLWAPEAGGTAAEMPGEPSGAVNGTGYLK